MMGTSLCVDTSTYGRYGNAPTQTAGGQNSGFGYGGSSSGAVGNSGGGGYYGGGGARGVGGPGSGGSSYISGYTGSVAITSASSSAPKAGCTNGTTDITCSYHYSGKLFTNMSMISGNSSMPTHNGTATMTGNSEDGYARITYIGN